MNMRVPVKAALRHLLPATILRVHSMSMFDQSGTKKYIGNRQVQRMNGVMMMCDEYEHFFS